MTDDMSQYVPNGGGGPLEPGYADFQNKDHTVSDLFDQAGPYAPSSTFQTIDSAIRNPQAQAPTDSQANDPSLFDKIKTGVGQAAGKAASNLKQPPGGGGQKEFGFSYIPSHLYSKGFDNPQERPQPARRSAPARGENAQAVAHQWYNDMREFGYKGGK